jgi:hypothetical protein
MLLKLRCHQRSQQGTSFQRKDPGCYRELDCVLALAVKLQMEQATGFPSPTVIAIQEDSVKGSKMTSVNQNRPSPEIAQAYLVSLEWTLQLGLYPWPYLAQKVPTWKQTASPHCLPV